MIQTFHVKGRLPGLNEMLAGARSRRGAGSKWSLMKRAAEQRIALCARAAKLKPVVGPAVFTYVFHEPNRRRDPSNLIAGGVKVLEDSLVELGILANDGWKHVAGIRSSCIVDQENEGVTVTIEEVRNT